MSPADQNMTARPRPKRFNKFHFNGQKTDENILLVLHRHWFDILSQFTLIFFMLLLLIGSFVIIPIFLPFFSTDNGRYFFAFFENLFFLLIWIMFFLVWIDYYFDVWIITDQRIVNIEQKGLFARVVSELELDKIQDITTDVQGIVPTFLNYGDLQVQTAAEQERFFFHNVPDPYAVKSLVMGLQKKWEDREENEFGEMLKKKIHHEDIS